MPKSCPRLPKLPEPAGNELKERLKEILASLSLNPPNELNPGDNSSSDTETRSQNTSNSLVYGYDIDSIDMAARLCFGDH